MTVEIKESNIVQFIRTYLSTIRRYSSLLPEERKDLLPIFWFYPSIIRATICKDGIAIEFRRKLKSKKTDSIRVSQKNFLNKINPKFTGLKVLVPADGLKGVVVKDLAITTESCLPFLKPSGTLFKIPNHFGLFRVTSGGDVFFENVGLFYLDRKGTPRQYTFRGMWIIANDSSLFFSIKSAQKRGLQDFIQRLVKTGAILGEKKRRYTEFDFTSEIEQIEREYLTRVNSDNIDELEMQNFLEQHKFIISPLYLDISQQSIDIEPQKGIPSIKRKVDFVLMQEPNFTQYKINCTAIEIKKPVDRLFLKNGEMSQALSVGIDQIFTIFKFVDLNLTEAQKLLPIESKSDLKGIVLIGRKKELTIEDIKRKENFNRTNNRIKIVLFDDLLENIRFVSRVFGKKMQQPAVVVGQAGTEDEDFTGKTGEVIQKAIDFLSKRIEKNEINIE